ncbi:hypothetical protein [Lebetimonas sp. JH292]|uniref:hypothetical protein n=1 Tax=Lebetimonas sp. JH292 TaxID=990068 RepID=UPI0004666999|nr:hypothetical protein [Lebetimonas sp. JH292]
MERREFLKIGAFSVLISTTTFKFANAEENEFMPVLIYDQSRCLDCKSCMAACQLEKNLPYDVVFFKIKTFVPSV